MTRCCRFSSLLLYHHFSRSVSLHNTEASETSLKNLVLIGAEFFVRMVHQCQLFICLFTSFVVVAELKSFNPRSLYQFGSISLFFSTSLVQLANGSSRRLSLRLNSSLCACQSLYEIAKRERTFTKVEPTK